MADRVRLRKAEPVDQLPAAIKLTGPGVSGTIPFMAEEIVLTEMEKKQLRAMGWKDGDPVPNLSKVISTETQKKLLQLAKEEQQRFKDSPDRIPADVRPMKELPPVVKLESLSEEEQTKYKAIIAKAIEDKKNLDRLGVPSPPISNVPGISEAVNIAHQVTEDYFNEEAKPRQKAKPKEVA